MGAVFTDHCWLGGPWWLDLGSELPRRGSGCPEDTCEAAEIEPVDLYCRDHERFLPLAAHAPGRFRPLVINAARFAACGAFVLAAVFHTAVPLFVLFAAAGAGATVLPLRLYRSTSRYVAACWATVCVAVVVAQHADAATARAMHTVMLAGATGAGGLLACALARRQSRHDYRTRRAAGVVAIILTAALAVWAVWAALRLRPGWFVPVTGWNLTVLWSVAFFGTALGTFLAMLVGAVDGAGRTADPVRPLLHRPGPPSIAWRGPSRTAWDELPAGQMERLERTIAGFCRQMLRAAVVGARAAATVALRAAYLPADAAVITVNCLHRSAVTLPRRARSALADTGLVVAAAAGIGARAAGRTVRVFAFPVLAMAAAVLLLDRSAAGAYDYLTGGRPAALGQVTVTAVLAAIALCLGWAALCGLPLRRALASARRSAAIAAPGGLLFVAVAGWAVGLPGSLGHGPIRPGWITLAATCLFGVAGLSARWRSRRASPARHRAYGRAPAPGFRSRAEEHRAAPGRHTATAASGP